MIVPFRDGGAPAAAPALAAPQSAGPQVLLADISEFQPQIADAAYLAWSKAIVIRCAYGDAHDDQAWYGGQRRDELHKGGARFLGIYQYLIAGQSGKLQAQAFHNLVGAIRPGEVFIADFEEGTKPVLTAWYNEMITLYGPSIHPYLWTYSGLNFGAAAGVLPVEWIAAYQAAEPASTHRLWQFTDAYPVPGVGTADCSVWHGTIDQLAALAAQPVTPPQQQYGPPRNLTVRPGDSTVAVLRCDPPAGAPPPNGYQISVFTGSYPSPETIVPSYPRWMKQAPMTFGSLQHIPAGEHMTCRAVPVWADGTRGAYADAHFVMP
jgi:hypothetical protein